MIRFQNPKSKFQINSKFQIPNSKRAWSLEFRSLELVWKLVPDWIGDGNWKLQRKAASGFTLLETIVALAVITAAVMGPVSLISRGIVNFSFAKNKIIAANLAEEAVELVRLIRDNNVMCDKLDNGTLDNSWGWKRDPHSTGVGEITGTWQMDATNLNPFSTPGAPASCVSSTLKSPVLQTGTDFLLFETNILSSRYGLYNHSSGSATAFSRSVSIAVPSTPDSDIPLADQLDVVAAVNWNERGTNRSVTVRERLYNWK